MVNLSMSMQSMLTSWIKYIDRNSFHFVYCWLIFSIVGTSVTLIFSAPTWIHFVVSIIIIVCGGLSLIFAMRKQRFTTILLLVSSGCILAGFSYYFKMDRDYSAYMINTQYLIQNGSFFSETDYFQWGLHITNGLQTPSFLFAYSAYLVPFVRVLGTVGFVIAHLFLLGIAVISLQQVLCIWDQKKISHRYLALVFLLSPIVVWLYSYTYSETLFLPLVWGAIAIFLQGKESQSWIQILLSYFAIAFAFTVRVEALGLMAFFALAIHILFIQWRIGWSRYCIAFCLALTVTVISILVVANISGNYVREQYADAITTVDIGDTENTWTDFIQRQRILFLSFGSYLVLIPFLWGVAYRDIFSKRQLYWILLLIFPFLLYLYNPRITRDFLWFLRRFITVIIPFIFIIGSIGLARFQQRYPKRITLLVTCYVLVQIVSISIILNYKIDQREYYTLLDGFFTETLTNPNASSIKVIGNISQANEASRILPYWAYTWSDLDYQTISIEDLDSETMIDSYFVYTAEIQRENLELLNVFRYEIPIHNPQWDPRLPIFPPQNQMIQLYVYQGIE